MRALCLIGSLLICTMARAELPANVAAELKKAGIPQDAVAVFVQPVDDIKPTFTHNASKSMNPASVMKLVTTYTALEALTPAYRWKTEVYRNGAVNNGVLEGDLIIKGYGDPSFKAQEFWRLLMSLQQAGIRQIRGNLMIDKSVFSDEVSTRNTFDDETWRAYNAMPSAFLVNGRNTSFKFTVQDGRVLVNQEFELPEVQVINQMKLRQGACGDWRNYFSYVVTPKNEGATVTFNGIFSPDCEERYLELSVISDTQYAFLTFKKLWAELGGQFNGKLQIGTVPTAALKVITQLSDPLGYVVRDINKWSNNLMARQLMLTLAVEKGQLPATEAKGANVIKEVLASKGLTMSELVLENGSGLSRVERISAEHLGQLLVKAYQSKVMPELMASLPILGLDGTTKKRMNESQASSFAHLKTGSLDGVSTVAGYVLDANNHRQVLVMLVNHPKAGASRDAQDALIEWVYRRP